MDPILGGGALKVEVGVDSSGRGGAEGEDKSHRARAAGQWPRVCAVEFVHSEINYNESGVQSVCALDSSYCDYTSQGTLILFMYICSM